MRFAAALFLTILLPSVAFAGPLEDGQTAITRKDFQAALKLLQPLADQGNAQAQCDIGAMYYHGEGVAEDKAAAMKWFLKASEQGHPTCQHYLGWMFAHADGVEKVRIR